MTVKADVAKRAEVEPMIEAVWKELGPIDILVNNATFGPYRPLEKFDQRAIARTLESSVGGPLHLIQIALPDNDRGTRSCLQQGLPLK